VWTIEVFSHRNVLYYDSGINSVASLAIVHDSEKDTDDPNPELRSIVGAAMASSDRELKVNLLRMRLVEIRFVNGAQGHEGMEETLASTPAAVGIPHHTPRSD